MTFGSFQSSTPTRSMAEINVTPMVDVMLVLLVIFIITAPLFNHEVKLNLPQQEASPSRMHADAIAITIDTHGRIFWDNRLLPKDELPAKLKAAAQRKPQPEIKLRADDETRYGEIVKLMASAQRAGLKKIGFVTEPKVATPPPAATPNSRPAPPILRD